MTAIYRTCHSFADERFGKNAGEYMSNDFSLRPCYLLLRYQTDRKSRLGGAGNGMA